MRTANDPKVIAKLLRAIARSERSKETKHDIIFIAAAELLERKPTDRQAIAKTIVGPWKAPPKDSKFSLSDLRGVRWEQSTRGEQLIALAAADAIIEEWL
jgi:hypothetical protein